MGLERLNLHKIAFIKYIAPDHRNNFHHHTMDVIESGTKQSADLKLLKPDNSTFYSHLETVKVEDEDGNFKEFRVTVTDITELKNTEKALKISEERYRDKHEIAEIN